MKKHFFKRGIGFVLLALLVVACGAEKSKKNSGNAGNPGINNYTFPGMGGNTGAGTAQNMQQAITNFAAWYNSTTENSGSRTGFAGGSITIATSYMQSSNCQNQQFFIFNIQTCSGSNSSQQANMSTVQITYVQNGQSKNTGRMAGFNLSSGSTPYGQIVNVQQYSNVFYFTVMRNNAYDTVVVDTSYNSAVNPMVISNSANRSVQQVVGVN